MSADKSLNADEPADEQALTSALTKLSTLVAGAPSTMHTQLTAIADFAMQAILGADGAGVTMLLAGKPDTIVASETFVRDVDNIQYRLGEGPCISAAATASTSMSGALGHDGSWPEFGPRAAELGIHSALSLPLLIDGQVIGALNVYAHAHDAFTDQAARIGEVFAVSAAVAVHNAHVLDEAHQQTARMQAALTNRAVIDRAVGIIMSRTGIDEDEAYLRLRIMSQQQHTELKTIADHLVQVAVRRARARISQPETQT